MSAELSVLNAVLAKRDFSLLVRQGLNDEAMFPDYGDAYRFIKRHVEEFGETPSVESVIAESVRQRWAHEFESWVVEESPETLCAKLHERNVKLRVTNVLQRIAGKEGVYAKLDGYELLRFLSDETEKIRQDVNARVGRGVVNWSRSATERIAQYERRKSGDDRRVVPLFWPAIDDAVGGFVMGRDYVDIEAATKVGKSWLGFIAGLTANGAGFRVLHELAESSKDEATARLDTLAFGINNRGIFAGKLAENEEARYISELERLQASGRPDYVIKTPEDWPMGLTVAQVEADIDLYAPDLVIIDQFNLMRHNEGTDHQAKANTSRALKLLFARKNVLGVVITQANGDFIKRKDRMEDDLDDGEIRELRPPKEGDYSETIAVRQDCTHMIALDAVMWRDDATGVQRGKALVVVEISRTGGAGTSIPLEWCPNDGIIRPRNATDEF